MTDENLNPDLVVDTKGQICPAPLIETKKAIKKLSPGQLLKLITTDPICPDNVDSWCEVTGNKLLQVDIDDDIITIYVQKT